MKSVYGMALIATSSLLMLSCNSGEATKQTSSQVKQTAMADAHAYACPMHPKVTGKAGDACPKCGMALKPSKKTPEATGGYYMQFAANTTTIAPDKEVVLSFTPKKKEAPNEQVALDVAHEKKIHLILVSDDLSWFDHVHPEATANGAYAVKVTFPAPGKYKVYADYKPSGGAQVVDQFDINVEGSAPAAKKFSEEKLSGTSGEYTFTIAPAGGQLLTGAATHMEGVVKKNGQPVDVNTLDNYLGAQALIVIISLNEKEYLHVHPEVAKGKFDIHTAFDKPGIYRGWIQFNSDNKLHTIDFTLNVKQGVAADVQKANAAHGTSSSDDHAGHSH